MEVGATFDFRCQCHVASILQAGVLVILLSVNTVFTTSSVRWQGPQLLTTGCRRCRRLAAVCPLVPAGCCPPHVVRLEFDDLMLNSLAHRKT